MNLRAGLPAYIGPIGLQRLALAAYRRLKQVIIAPHDRTDAVHQKPCGLHAAIEGPLYLPGANPLLAGANQMDHLQPKAQREVAILENRTNPHGKGLPTGIALAKARAARLTLKPPNSSRVSVTTMRANRTVRPKVRFDKDERRVFAMEVGSGQNLRAWSRLFGHNGRVAFGRAAGTEIPSGGG